MTMTEKIIALVDYENIGTLESVRLSRYERLILFTGPQQEFIRFPAVTYAGDISVSVFQVANVSKNNVDFHLVFELGRLREGANKQVISSQADSLIKISRIWADFFPQTHRISLFRLFFPPFLALFPVFTEISPTDVSFGPPETGWPG
jgi:hypothetical protein